MLQAKSNDHELITLAMLTRNEIEHVRKSKLFFCPVCNERVIIKAGRHVIPHFAHEPKNNCLSHEGGEGHYHEKGKLLLYQWLKLQLLHVQLEKYIPSINQRADLLLTIQSKKIAIEFQCARISTQQIYDRTVGYQKAGIQVIWILGARLFKRVTKQQIQIDSFTSQFIHQFHREYPPTLFYFCPESLQFTIIQDIVPTSGKRSIVNLRFAKMNKLPFHDLFTPKILSKVILYQQWKWEKRRFRLRHNSKIYGRELAWRRWLYAKQTHLEYLPSLIYLPVSGQLQMKTPLWDWQSRLCLDIIDRATIGQVITLQTCMQYVRNHFQQKKQRPLIQATFNPVEQYLQLLCDLKILQLLSPGYYKKISTFSFYNHIDEAIDGDSSLMEQLVKLC